jgi:hypothetical protein
MVSKRVSKSAGKTASRNTSKKVSKKAPVRRRRAKTRAGKVLATAGGVTVTEVDELDALRKELERLATRSAPPRWNADPADVERSVAQLVLTLVEFIRKILERQAIRRMEEGTLTDAQVEDIGTALMTLEATIRDMAATFGIGPDDLNLDLGPLGKLM